MSSSFLILRVPLPPQACERAWGGFGGEEGCFLFHKYLPFRARTLYLLMVVAVVRFLFSCLFLLFVDVGSLQKLEVGGCAPSQL